MTAAKFEREAGSLPAIDFNHLFGFPKSAKSLLSDADILPRKQMRIEESSTSIRNVPSIEERFPQLKMHFNKQHFHHPVIMPKPPSGYLKARKNDPL